MMKKFTLFVLLVFGCVSFNALLAQVEEEEPVQSMEVQEDDVVEKESERLYKSAIGLRTGFFSTIAASYNTFFSERSAFNVDFGYRIPGGWTGTGENTRLGGVATYQYHIPLNISEAPDQSYSVYIAGGVFGAQADYSERPGGLRDYGESFFTGGLTAGIGLDIRWGRVNLTGEWLPGYGLINHEASDNFYIWRCSGVTARYLF